MPEPIPTPPVAPLWESGDHQRRALAARIRGLRSLLIAGSLAGTVMFTAAAAYHTKTTKTTGATTPTAVFTTTENQTTSANFFTNQTTAPARAAEEPSRRWTHPAHDADDHSDDDHSDGESDDGQQRQSATSNGTWFFSSAGSSGPSFFSNRSTTRSS